MVKHNYRANPYHNFRHAFDVTQTCYLFLKHGILANAPLTPLDVFSMMVSALCHDLQHPGMNNTFQCNARTKLALTYNDISVLENFHASVAFQLLLGTDRQIIRGDSIGDSMALCYR
jgi:hypothetical protein